MYVALYEIPTSNSTQFTVQCDGSWEHQIDPNESAVINATFDNIYLLEPQVTLQQQQQQNFAFHPGTAVAAFSGTVAHMQLTVINPHNGEETVIDYQ